MARLITKKGTIPKRKKTSSKVKKAIAKRGASKITRISKKQRTEWETKSLEEQTQYLKDHPDSRFHKLGVTKKPPETPNTSNPEASLTKESETTQENPLKTPREVPQEEIPLVSKLDPKASIKDRIKSALDSVKQGWSGIKTNAKEGYSEGLHEALNNPLKLEEIQKRREEYSKNPPSKPRDNHDKLMMLMGVAAIVAFGGLAVAAPGLAIVAGMSLTEHAPELVRAIGENMNRRREERGGNEDHSKDLPDIIGDTVEEHVKKEELKGSEYFEARRKELEEQNSEALKRLENKWEGDTNWKSKREDDPEKTSESGSEDPNQKTNSKARIDTNKENKTDKSKTNKNTVVDDDDENLDEDDDEEEPPPSKKRGKKSRVESRILATVRSGFVDLTRQTHPLQEPINKTVHYIQSLLRQRDKENPDSNATKGTYAALKLHPSSARLLAEWAKKKGIKNAYPPGEFHITTCYSRKPIDYKPLSFIHGGREVKPKNLGLLGREDDKKYIVLHLQPQGFPHRRFHYARTIGATHDFPDYLPHISIAPPGHGYTSVDRIDTSDLNFPLIVDYEYSDELKIQSTIDIADSGYIINKPNPVRAKRMEEAGVLNYDGRDFSYKKGDFEVQDKTGDKWIVRNSIFKEKYREQDDGSWDKNPVNYTYKITPKDCIVKTLEGPVEAKSGDVIITGTKGEQWPVTRARFNQLYSVVVDRKIIR